MSFAVSVSLIDSVRLIPEGPDQMTVALENPASAWRTRLSLKQLSPGLSAVMERLSGHGRPMDALVTELMQTEGFPAIAKLRHYLQKLQQYGMLRYTLAVNDTPFAIVEPLTVYFRYRETKPAPDTAYLLSKFAYCRRDGHHFTVNCPLAHARVTLLDGGALAGLHCLAQPRTAVQLAAATSLDVEGAQAYLNLLQNAGTVQEVDAEGQTVEDGDPALGQWAFHDLLFHANSRMGRHADPYDGTFFFQNRYDPLPALKPDMCERIIPLFRPDPEAITQPGRSFESVLSSRQTIRHYGDDPISIKQLGEFLYRSARIKKLVAKAGVSWRPSPGGGAIHELEVYTIVNRCQGLDFGVYHYNPLGHHLCRIETAPEPMVKSLLDLARLSGQLEQPPQLLFVLTARFQRIQYKYQSVAYAVILKDVGCVYQTMYLVATAMGLAPCALGGGDSDMFAAIAGLNYYAETSVGEFLLGSGPAVRPEPLTPPKRIFDPSSAGSAAPG